MSKSKLSFLDIYVIGNVRKAFLPGARLGLFILFAWFGALKVFGLSTASALLSSIHDMMLPSLSNSEFYMVLGIYEVVIGLTLLIKGFERTAFILLLIYLVVAIGPLFFASNLMWESWFVPTLVGEQYIKFLLLIMIAVGIAAQLITIRRSKSKKAEDEKPKK